jgi:hypothetical protein
MALLKSLSFGALAKPAHTPLASRRASLIEKLEHQRSLAADPTYVRKDTRRVSGEDGGKKIITIEKRVRPWWREDVHGVIGFEVRFGSKVIELERGKPAVIVPARDQLVGVIDSLLAAVRGGELDEHLSKLGPARPKTRKADKAAN